MKGRRRPLREPHDPDGRACSLSLDPIENVIGGWRNAQHTLQSQGIVSGFGFLEKSTGWDVNFSLLPTTPNDPYWWFFVVGILNTLFLGALGLMLATLVLPVAPMICGANSIPSSVKRPPTASTKIVFAVKIRLT